MIQNRERFSIPRYYKIGGIVIIVILLFLTLRGEQSRILLRGEVQRLDSIIGELHAQQRLLTEQLGQINATLKEKETKIETLTGELQTLKVENKAQLEELQDKINNLKSQNQDFSAVIDVVIPAVVSIRTDVGSGSGFIVDEEGYVVTNYHVIEGATAATVLTSDGQDYAVRLVNYNQQADVAVLELQGNNFHTVPFGDSDRITVGERVIAVGNPGGLDFSVTQGIISATNREDSSGNEYIQIDVPINPGNSGGPLVDINGKVMGMNTKKIADFEGVGFALAANEVKGIVDDIIAQDKIG